MKSLLLTLCMIASTFCYSAMFDDFILLYEKYGNEKYMIQEDINQKNHVLQAAYLAKVAGAPEDVIVGLLFHDVGQVANKEYVGNVEVLHCSHAEFGENWLESRNFPKFVCEWVRDHALAKVILCEEDPYYYEHLSLASQESYHYQKKKYDQPENHWRYECFNNHARKSDFLAARKCDDMAKIVDFTPPSFEEYRSMVQRVIDGQGGLAVDEAWRKIIDDLYIQMTAHREKFEDQIRK